MSSKKIILTIVFIGLLILVYLLFIPKYKFHYYYSKDKSQVLTRVTYPNTLLGLNQTYFTPGNYNRHNVPAVYVKPRYSSDWDWDVYVIFHSKGIFLTGGNSAEVKNLSGKFLYIYGSYYNEHKAMDSLISTFKDTTYFALYSFDD